MIAVHHRVKLRTNELLEREVSTRQKELQYSPGTTVTVKRTVVSVWFSLKSFTMVDIAPPGG